MDEKYMKAAGAGIALVILLQVPSVFGTFLPNPCDVSKERPGSQYSYRVRQSEIYAALIATALGVAGSYVANSPWPFFATMALVGVIVFHYESSLRYEMTGD